MMQYYFVDKYAGMNYKYEDGSKFYGRSIVIMSSIATLVLQSIGIGNLASMYDEVQFWMKLKAFLFYIKQKITDSEIESLEQSQPCTLQEQKLLREVFVKLKKQADLDHLVERTE